MLVEKNKSNQTPDNHENIVQSLVLFPQYCTFFEFLGMLIFEISWSLQLNWLKTHFFLVLNVHAISDDNSINITIQLLSNKFNNFVSLVPPFQKNIS